MADKRRIKDLVPYQASSPVVHWSWNCGSWVLAPLGRLPFLTETFKKRSRILRKLRVMSEEVKNSSEIYFFYLTNLLYFNLSLFVCVAQNVLAGDGVGICDELISLEITSPDVCDLTLIDLPGITRVPVKGQPEDIGDQVYRQFTWLTNIHRISEILLKILFFFFFTD